MKWVGSWLGLIAVLIGVAFGLAALVNLLDGSDDEGRPQRPAVKVEHDPQCGRYTPEEPFDGSAPPFDRCEFEIERYCEYGSVSRAQLDSCLKRVRWGQIKRLNTNAAEFARDYEGKCVAGSGPFCNELETEAP